MKRVICIVLVCVMTLCALSSCSSLNGDDKGAVVTMYLADEIYNFDPIVGYNDTATAKILSLVFEGLTTLDEDGNWQKGMMKNYKVIKPETDEENYKLQINLKNTKWSDGRTVQANDFVYAWKRIVEPTTKCSAACMLYDVKNARDIKMGDATVDDLGVYAVETYVLEIEFEHEVDTDAFFRTCASVALVPLREDKVGTNDDTWAKRASTMVTNGPFDIRRIDYGSQLRLERSTYYLRDTDSNQALDKYVTPYRLVVNYGLGDSAKQVEAYENNDIFYLSQIAIDSRADYEKSAEISDSAITTAFYFNTSNKMFEDSDVRRALSLAIDRQAIADMLVFAEPATGLIPHKVFDAKAKGDFRDTADKSGELIASSADTDEAKSLLKKAGVTKGKFTLTVRDDELDKAIAEYVANAWEELGFTVKVDALGSKAQKNTEANQSVVYDDLYQQKFESGEFDVIAVDFNMLTSDAFSALAPFATKFSGNGVDMESDDYDVIGNITGYASDDYDELIEQAFAETDSTARTELLHKAEEMLLTDMPIIPVVFQKDAYVSNSKVISGIKDTYWGRDFSKLSMKDYMKYKESIEALDSQVAEEN